MNDSKIPNKVSSCFYSESFLFSDFFVYLQEKSTNLETMIQEYFYVSYGNYSGTTASRKEAKLMEERFKLLEHNGRDLSTCGLETANSADNDSVKYL